MMLYVTLKLVIAVCGLTLELQLNREVHCHNKVWALTVVSVDTALNLLQLLTFLFALCKKVNMDSGKKTWQHNRQDRQASACQQHCSRKKPNHTTFAVASYQTIKIWNNQNSFLH